MSYNSVSEEVAADFAESLNALNLNNRYEISGLTVIAKENTEHAHAISEALRTHIKQTLTVKKLPAFYVMDSIVKNVGTPYTLFFGRHLYNTFMEAYLMMDNSVRRKMDEMLKTWKEPVPGSMDAKPVFPTEVTRPIENALIKARTSAVQAQQEQMRNNPHLNRSHPGSAAAQYRQTPTPPNAARQAYHAPQPYGSGYASQYAVPGNGLAGSVQYQTPSSIGPAGHQYSAPGNNPNGSQYPTPSNGPTNYPPYSAPSNGSVTASYPSQTNGYPLHGLPPRPPPSQFPPEQAGPSWQQTQGRGYVAPETSLNTLNSDIANLIATSRSAIAQNPYDEVAKGRLKALTDLQNLLAAQRLPQEQLALIRERVTELAEAAIPIPKIQSPQAYVPRPATIPQAPTQPPAFNPGPGLLAALAKQKLNSQAPTPPTVAATLAPQTQYQPPPAQSLPTPTPPPAADPMSLLEQLRQRGILPPSASSTPTPIPMPNPLLGFPPRVETPPNPSRTPLAEIPNDCVLTSGLKMPRPHLIASLYQQLGIPCAQCGRRFQSDAAGKEAKQQHMDWHFRIKNRMVEAESKGQHRSWYVDEMDWIKSRESDTDNAAALSLLEDGGAGAGAGASRDEQEQRFWMPVPDEADKKASVCPVCQEKFEMRWADEAQEFVWEDAREVAGRVYHATCWREVSKGVVAGAEVGGGVLGKRKAEDDQIAMRTKIKTEPF